ncbi:MAG: hypothetical protein DSY86_07915, partial [Marinomonas sp.]
MRILVVEDTEVLGQAICDRLSSLGHGADLIQDGKQANDFLRYQSVDLIILDLNLPNVSGLQILQALRQREDATPVLILTARDQVDDRIRLLDAGSDDYLTKFSVCNRTNLFIHHDLSTIAINSDIAMLG